MTCECTEKRQEASRIGFKVFLPTVVISDRFLCDKKYRMNFTMLQSVSV